MKKLKILCGLVFLSTAMIAQNEKMELGLKAGINYTNKVTSNDFLSNTEFNGTVGFMVGGFLNLNFSDKFRIRLELLYLSQKSEFSAGEVPGGGNGDPFSRSNSMSSLLDGEIKESMISIPVLFQYELFENFFGEAGPGFGYVLDRKIIYVQSIDGIVILRNSDAEKFELGINVGVVYEFIANFGVDIRYTYGLTERQDLNNSSIQLGLNYTL